MTDSPEWLSQRMIQEGQKTVAFFQGLNPEQYELELYTDGAKWKVRQLLAHFTATESGIFRLIQNILGGGKGVPQDFDIDFYNEKKVSELNSMILNDLLEQFVETRQASARFVAGLTMDDLHKEGRHPFLGVVPLVDMIKLLYRHNQIHLRDVRRMIAE